MIPEVRELEKATEEGRKERAAMARGDISMGTKFRPITEQLLIPLYDYSLFKRNTS